VPKWKERGPPQQVGFNGEKKKEKRGGKTGRNSIGWIVRPKLPGRGGGGNAKSEGNLGTTEKTGKKLGESRRSIETGRQDL